MTLSDTSHVTSFQPQHLAQIHRNLRHGVWSVDRQRPVGSTGQGVSVFSKKSQHHTCTVGVTFCLGKLFLVVLGLSQTNSWPNRSFEMAAGPDLVHGIPHHTFVIEGVAAAQGDQT